MLCFFTGSPASAGRTAAGRFFFLGHQFLHVGLAKLTAGRETVNKRVKKKLKPELTGPKTKRFGYKNLSSTFFFYFEVSFSYSN